MAGVDLAGYENTKTDCLHMKCIVLITMFSFFQTALWCQCSESLRMAESALGEQYIAIPQHVETLIKPGDTLSFEAVWLANNTYRIATSQIENQNIEIILFDEKKNLIFNSSEFNYPRAWDFFVEQSLRITCIVRCLSASNEQQCLTVLTGFKK